MIEGDEGEQGERMTPWPSWHRRYIPTWSLVYLQHISDGEYLHRRARNGGCRPSRHLLYVASTAQDTGRIW